MVRYLVQRLLFFIPVALLVSFLTFMTIHLVPGDPARVILGEDATPQAVVALDQQLGLDKPLPTQFGIWFWQALHGNLGDSIQLQQPVLEAIWQRLPVSAELGLSALLLSLLLAVPLGIYAATHRDSWVDRLVNVLSLLGTAVPSFVLGLVLLLLLSVDIRIFPPGGYVQFSDDPAGNIRSLILPMVTLAAATVAINLRQMRASMIEVLAQDYIRTARAKGIGESRIYYSHALRNAVIPLLTVVGLQIGAIFAGTFIVETIFLWPGIGQLAVNSILAKDYPVIQGVVLISALAYMLANLLVDIGYGLLNPQIRLHE